jgi:hypothetical protein
MTVGKGYMPSPTAGRELAPDFFAAHPDHPRLQAHVTVTPRDRKYLSKILELAASKGIRVVLLGMVVPEELNRVFETNGFFGEYRAYLSELEAAHPLVVPPAADVWVFDNADFGDFQHLNDRGSELYTRRFKTEIFDPAVASLAGDSP